MRLGGRIVKNALLGSTKMIIIRRVVKIVEGESSKTRPEVRGVVVVREEPTKTATTGGDVRYAQGDIKIITTRWRVTNAHRGNMETAGGNVHVAQMGMTRQTAGVHLVDRVAHLRVPAAKPVSKHASLACSDAQYLFTNAQIFVFYYVVCILIALFRDWPTGECGGPSCRLRTSLSTETSSGRVPPKVYGRHL